MGEKNKVRRVRVPSETLQVNVAVAGPGPKAGFPYSYFMEFLLRSGQVFRSGEDGGRVANNIDQSYRNRKKDEEGEYFDLEQRPQEQWQSMLSALKKSVSPWPVPPQEILPYFDSIKDAEEVEVE